MTRKHFRAIAKALKGTRPEYKEDLSNVKELEQWKADVEAVMLEIQEFNFFFDEDKFKRACGYWEE